MRAIAVLASLAVAVMATSIPASLESAVVEPRAAWVADTDRDGDPGDRPMGSSRGESSEEDESLDDLDDLDDLDELLAVLDVHDVAFFAAVLDTTWHAHEARAHAGPHPEDTLRPPIAS